MEKRERPEDFSEVEEIFTTDDWQRVKDTLLREMNEGVHPERDIHFLHIAARAKELFHDALDALPVDDQWERSVTLLSSLRGKDWFGFAKTAARIVAVYPDRISELRLNEEVRTGILNLIEANKGKDWEVVSGLVARLEILFPGEGRKLSEEDQIWTGMKSDLESVRGSDWFGFAYQAAHMYSLQPDKQIELGLDLQAWRGMRGVLESYKSDPEMWRGLIELAYNMNILKDSTKE